MAAFTKTVRTDLITLQEVANNTVVIGTGFSLDTHLGGIVHVRFGRLSTTTGGAGVNIRIESSMSAAGSVNTWFPLAVFTTNFATASSQAVTTSSASGQKVISMTATAGMNVGDLVYIDNTTTGNSEWARVKLVTTNTSITIEDNLANTQGTSSVVYDSAEIFPPVIIPEACRYVRAVVDGANWATVSFAVHVGLITIDSIA